MKMGDIASAEEEDDPDDIPEGFHLQEESPHCINMTRADDYQAYLRQIVLEFERLIKSGATNISEEYAKVIQSMFWAVKANKQTILNGADPAEVLASVPDARCKAWKLKLNGKTAIDPTTLVDSTEIGPQMASDMVNLKPQDVPKYIAEWEHSSNGRATAYLATLVCRYMHELQQKDKKVVLSAKALETIYHTVSSSIGKLISGKQYLGGAALEQLRDKVEAEGKELPFKKKKKLPQRSSGLAKTSGAASKD